MTLKLFQYLDDNINSAPPKYQSCSCKTVGVVWIQRSKMAVILYFLCSILVETRRGKCDCSKRAQQKMILTTDLNS